MTMDEDSDVSKINVKMNQMLWVSPPPPMPIYEVRWRSV